MDEAKTGKKSLATTTDRMRLRPTPTAWHPTRETGRIDN